MARAPQSHPADQAGPIGDTPLYTPSSYVREQLPYWQKAAARQAAKDAVLIPELARHFKPGSVLELGAGVGQISLLLQSSGWNVLASDYADFFVEHMRRLGLDAHRIDATAIAASGLGPFANIFAQSITPFITLDYAVVRRAYESAFQALEPDGRLVLIHAMAPRRSLGATMRIHESIAHEVGYAEVRLFRNQLLPSPAYRPPFHAAAAFAERHLGRRYGHRFVVVARKPLR